MKPRMRNQEPIVIVEDDLDDQEIYLESIEQLNIPHPVLFFKTANEALQYLNTTPDKPFLIISDINMPAMNGLELRRQMEESNSLLLKRVPFVFISTNASRHSISSAYELNVQGFFRKPDKIDDFKKMLKLLIEYWTLCHQNDH